MSALDEKEKKLRVFIKRIDEEIMEFKESEKNLIEQVKQLGDVIRDKGLEQVPINIASDSNTDADLLDEVRRHLLALNKMRNYISQKLDLVIKEEELLEELQKIYGKKVQIKKADESDFEIIFRDKETEKTFKAIVKSKEFIEDLKESVQKIMQ